MLVYRGGFKHFFVYPDPWGNDPIWRAYFWNGLKPPTSKPMGYFLLKMDPLKMYFLWKMRIFHCYVSLPEGTFSNVTWYVAPCGYLWGKGGHRWFLIDDSNLDEHKLETNETCRKDMERCVSHRSHVYVYGSIVICNTIIHLVDLHDKGRWAFHTWVIYIYTYYSIYHCTCSLFLRNVGKYTIHGSYGCLGCPATKDRGLHPFKARVIRSPGIYKWLLGYMSRWKCWDQRLGSVGYN